MSRKTVKELIEQLRQFPEDYEVAFVDSGDFEHTVWDVRDSEIDDDCVEIVLATC